MVRTSPTKGSVKTMARTISVLVLALACLSAGAATIADADALFKEKRWRKAAEAYEAVASGRGDRGEKLKAAMRAALSHENAGSLKDAEKWADKVIRESAGRAKRCAEVYDEMVSDIKEDEYPKSPEAERALFYRTTLAIWTKRWDEAKALRQLFVGRYPNSRQIGIMKGEYSELIARRITSLDDNETGNLR